MEQKKRHRIPLAVKIYAIVAVVLMGLAAGLIFIGYRTHRRYVDQVYNDLVKQTEKSIREWEGTDRIQYFCSQLATEEFEAVRREAVEADDERIIERWMRSKPNFMGEWSGDDEPRIAIGDQLLPDCLYSDYFFLKDNLNYTADWAEMPSIFLTYRKDGALYTAASSEKGILGCGERFRVFDNAEELGGDGEYPYAIYESGDGWRFTTLAPVFADGAAPADSSAATAGEPQAQGGSAATASEPQAQDGSAVTADGSQVQDDSAAAADGVACMVGLSINMTEIVRARHQFVNSSITYVLLIAVLNVVVAILAVSRLVTRRIRKLARAMTSFADGGQAVPPERALPEDVGFNDEIGDLYTEFRSMQQRIKEYTENLAKVMAERERMQAELDMAASIQSNAVPSVFPPFPDRSEFALHARMEPAKEVGGDFYDYFLIDADHLALVIADVTGKGIPAALFMMSAKTLIHARAKEGGTPAEILSSVNRELSENNEACMFVTVWLGILDIRSGTVISVNAGHMDPILMRENGRAVPLKGTQDVFMGYSRAVFHDETICLQAGDALFLYTDGLTEANANGKTLYGEARLVKALMRTGAVEPREIIDGVWEEIKAYTEGAEPFDDMTALCLRYKGNQKMND